MREVLTEIDANAEGCVTNAQPQITLTSSFKECISSARSPGLLPPIVGDKLVGREYYQALEKNNNYRGRIFYNRSQYKTLSIHSRIYIISFCLL